MPGKLRIGMALGQVNLQTGARTATMYNLHQFYGSPPSLEARNFSSSIE